ncbi:MAG: hypothetical protein Q9208_003250 [Pyrenodesmia sp. 3 TL-2023]
MAMPNPGRQKTTLQSLPAELIHLIAEELYKTGAPSDLYTLYRIIASPATAAPTAATPFVESWLYRDIDLDFAGAESVGTTRLLKSLFDEKLDVRNYVRQLTVTIGPLAMRQGGVGFRQRVIALRRYLEYVSKLIPLLPKLQTFRWNTLLPMSFRIFYALREQISVQNLHVTLLLDAEDGFVTLGTFKRARFSTLSFTLYSSSPTTLQLLGLEKNATFSWAQYGRLLYADGDRAVVHDQTKVDDQLILLYPRSVTTVDQAKQKLLESLPRKAVDEPGQERVEPDQAWDGTKQERPCSNWTIIDKLYLDGFRFGDKEQFEWLRRWIDFGKLTFLEVRHCHDIIALLNYMLDELVGGINLKTIRVVGVQPHKDRSHVNWAFDLYNRFFGTYKGFEEIVIDDNTFAPFLIRQIGPSETLKRLELHFPRERYPEQRSMKEPLILNPVFAAKRDADAIKEIGRLCQNLTELNIDLRLEETTDNEVVTAFESQKGIESLSISFQSDETIDVETAERLARNLYSARLRHLEIHYRPVFSPYITRWDRFGTNEPWPTRTPEESIVMGSPEIYGETGEGNPTYGLRWMVDYQGWDFDTKDAWLLTGTAHQKALRRVCKATGIRSMMPYERRESSGVLWCTELYLAAQDLTVDPGDVSSGVPIRVQRIMARRHDI